MTEIRFVPSDSSSLDQMYKSLNDCQVLHPDPSQEDSDDEGKISFLNTIYWHFDKILNQHFPLITVLQWSFKLFVLQKLSKVLSIYQNLLQYENFNYSFDLKEPYTFIFWPYFYIVLYYLNLKFFSIHIAKHFSLIGAEEEGDYYLHGENNEVNGDEDMEEGVNGNLNSNFSYIFSSICIIIVEPCFKIWIPG